jgi:hypothetical protein
MPIEVLFVLASLLVAVVLSVKHGGLPERLAATVIAAWILTDWTYHQVFGPSGFATVDPVHVVLDGAELSALMIIALRANRMWPMWAAGAQLICVCGHLAVFMGLAGGMQRAYWAMTQLPQYIQLCALLLGVAAHARRTRRVGPYRSWRLA